MFKQETVHTRQSSRLKRKKMRDVWEYREPDRSQAGSPLRAMTFGTTEFSTRAADVEAH